MQDRVFSIVAIVISIFSLYSNHQDSLTIHGDAQSALSVSNQANTIAQAAQFDAQRANEIAQKSLDLSSREADSHQPRVELKSCSYGVPPSNAGTSLQIGLSRSSDAWANDTTPQYAMPNGADILSCVLRNSGDREATDITIAFPYEYVGWRGLAIAKSDRLLTMHHGNVSIAALQPGEEFVLEVYNADARFAADVGMGDAYLQYRFSSMTSPAPETLYKTSSALGRLCPLSLSCTKDDLARL